MNVHSFCTIPIPHSLAPFSLFSLGILSTCLLCHICMGLRLGPCVCLSVLIRFCPLKPGQEAGSLAHCLGATHSCTQFSSVHACMGGPWSHPMSWSPAYAQGCHLHSSIGTEPQTHWCAPAAHTVALTGHWFKYRVAYARWG